MSSASTRAPVTNLGLNVMGKKNYRAACMEKFRRTFFLCFPKVRLLSRKKMLGTSQNMAFRRKGKFRRARGYKRKATKVGAKLLRDAKSRGTNSKLEKAVRIISKKMATEQIKKLLPPNRIFRRECWGVYNRTLNLFAGLTQIDMATSRVYHCAQIPASDVMTRPTGGPPAADPNFVVQPTYPNRGPNILFKEVDLQGFRDGNVISIKNVSVQFLFELGLTTPGVSPTVEKHVIRWALCTVMEDGSHAAQFAPSPDQILPYKGMGFSNRLDQEVTDRKEETKLRILKRGSTSMSHKLVNINRKWPDFYWKGNLAYEYQSTDPAAGTVYSSNGQEVVSPKLFLCLAASTPASSPYKVKCYANIKVGYCQS